MNVVFLFNHARKDRLNAIIFFLFGLIFNFRLNKWYFGIRNEFIEVFIFFYVKIN